MRIECKNCRSSGHPTYACTKSAKSSTASRMDVKAKAKGGSFVHKGEAQSDDEQVDQSGERRPAGRRSGVQIPPTAGTQALPVDTNGKEKDHRDHSEQGLGTGRNASAGAIPASSASKFDKVAYQRLYMREVYRPRLKAKKEAMK